MSIEQTIAQAVAQAFADRLAKIEANQQAIAQSQQETVVALGALAEALRGVAPPTTPPPPPIPDDPVGTARSKDGESLRWHGSAWKLSGGKILRNDQATPDVALTAGVKRISIEPIEGDATGILVHANAEGKFYRYSGSPNWSLVQSVGITGTGSVVTSGPELQKRR